MVRVKGKVKAKVRRPSVKSGSKNNVKGGIPTEKIIKIGIEIKKDKNG